MTRLKRYGILATITLTLSSCLKHSITDAMLEDSGKKAITATLSYEINGKPINMKVEDSDNQVSGNRRLACEKSNGFVLWGAGNDTDFEFTFYTDSLRVGNYKYLGSYGASYVTTFEGKPQYVYGPTDHMDVNITQSANGHISGNFSGQLTPAVIPGYPNNIYGTLGSVVIKKGSFTNIPVVE